MASSELMPAACCWGDLPRDALLEILVRIPAKDLCRLRAVSPSWRALTCEPLFIAEHKSRHTAPLLAVSYKDQDMANGVDIVDLSGDIVRRIPSIESDILTTDKSGRVYPVIRISEDSIRVVRTRLDLVCFTRKYHPLGIWVLNPATGATLVLPKCHSEELAHDDDIQANYGRGQMELCALGQVSSTGEYKLIRIVSVRGRQLCEVITLDGTNYGRWRGKQGPPSLIFADRDERMQRCVVVDEVVYFLMNFYSSYCNTGVITIEPGSIASFNLETEEWMGTLRGPAPIRTFVQDHKGFIYADLTQQLSLTELDGSLVTVQNIHYSSMDLWFLTDFENAIWEKKYNIPPQFAQFFVYPFLVLDDGRIFFSYGESITSYDLITGTYVDAYEVRDSRSIGIYTGSLLSL